MTRIILASTLVVASFYAAHAFGLGEGNRFGRLGTAGKKVVAGSTTGFILLVDGSSHLLKVDGTSHICKAGGC